MEELLLGLDTLSALIMVGLVMGGAELVKRVFDRDWIAVATIVVCGLIGGGAGLAMGITFLQGLAFGMAATGYYSLVQKIGG